MRRVAFLSIAVSGCLHGGAVSPPAALLRVPVFVAQDVLVEPADFPRAQPLRSALVSVLLDEGYCLDRRGDFEIFLQLRVDRPAGGGALHFTLTADTGTGVRLDEFDEPLDALPSSREEAERAVRWLVAELNNSSPVLDRAESSRGCSGCCAARKSDVGLRAR